jgi:hypothetical protein
VAADDAGDKGAIPEKKSGIPGADAPLYDDNDLKMFALDTHGKLCIHGAGESVTLKAGWKLIVLSLAE